MRLLLFAGDIVVLVESEADTRAEGAALRSVVGGGFHASPATARLAA